MPTTMPTLKALALSVTDVVANMACLAGVGRVYKDQLDTRFLTLVGQKLAQLIKRPTIATPTLRFRSWHLVGALSDPSQVFQRNTLVGLLGLLHKSIADGVVAPSLKASFSSCQPFQQLATSPSRTACALGSFFLERRSKLSKMVSDFAYVMSTVGASVRGYCNICPAQINSDRVGRFLLWRRLTFHLYVDVVAAIFALTQCCAGWLAAFEESSLVVADQQVKPLPTTQQSQANSPVFLPKRKDPSIVVNTGRSKLLDRLSIFLSCLAVSSHTVNGPDSEVGRQAKSGPHISINQSLDSQIAGQFGVNSLVNPFTSICKSLQRLIDLSGDLIRNFELASNCQNLFHNTEGFTV